MTAHLTNGEKLKHFGPKRKKWRRRTHSCLCLSIKGGEWICVTNWIVILLGSLRHQLKLNQSAAPNKSRPEFLQNHFIPTMIKAPETIWTCHMAYAFCMLEALVWTRINEPTTYDICLSSKHTTTADWSSSNLQSYCCIEAFHYRFNYFSIKLQYKIFMF